MLRRTMALGHIAGVRIGAHWSALATLGLFTFLLGRALADAYGNSAEIWLTAALGAIGLLAALLAHELAHSIVARRDGVPVEGVVLWLLGGVSELGAEPQSPRSDLRIALAGPLTSLALAAGCFGLAVAVGTAAGAPVLDTLVWLSVTNLILAVFNLLPGAPLDGGRVLRALVWRWTGDQLRAAATAARSGRILGLVLLALGAAELIAIGNTGGVWLMLLGWFVSTAANAELTAAGLRHQLGGIRVRDVMSANPVTIPASWSVAELLTSPAARSDHQVFPVVDPVGRPIAVVSWGDLAALAPRTRAATSVLAAARPLPASARADEEDLLSAVATRVVLRPESDLVIAVDRIGRVIGVVSAADLALACHRSALGLPMRTAVPQHKSIPGTADQEAHS